jgi:protein SCO1
MISTRRRRDAEATGKQVISVPLRLCVEKNGTWVVALYVALLAVLLPIVVAADTQPDVGQPATKQPEMLRGVGIDQRLDQAVPLDLVFRNEAGAPVTLGSLLRGKPVILNLAYYRCPMLCTLVMNGLLGAMKALPFDAGKEFDVITLSFDPTDTAEVAAAKKAAYLEQYRRLGAADGWHFLTGDADAIERLAGAVGFRYRYDPQRNEFAHAAGLTVLTPRGIVARYLFGVEFAPRDLKFALMEAAENRIGSPVDQLLLFCYHYDPSTGRYSSAVLTSVRAAGLVTVLALIGFIGWAVRRERRPTHSASRHA